MFQYIKELFGKKKIKKETTFPSSSRLKRVYDEPTKRRDDSGDFLISMAMMNTLTSTPDADQHSSRHSDDSNGFDGGFGGGSFSGGGSGSSWGDSSSSSSDSSSSYDSSFDSSSSND